MSGGGVLDGWVVRAVRDDGPVALLAPDAAAESGRVVNAENGSLMPEHSVRLTVAKGPWRLPVDAEKDPAPWVDAVRVIMPDYQEPPAP